MSRNWLEIFSKRKGLQIFDPRRNQDFVFAPNKGITVSSLREELVVVLIPPGYTTLGSTKNPIRQAIFESLSDASGVGFVCAYAVPDEIARQLPHRTKESSSSGLSYFDPTLQEFVKHGSIIERLRYGEITLGCASEPFVDLGAKQEERYDDSYVLTRIKNIRWFLSFYADTGNAYVVARANEGADKLLSRVRREDPASSNN